MKEQKGEFLGMLTATLGTSLFGKSLSGKSALNWQRNH